MTESTKDTPQGVSVGPVEGDFPSHWHVTEVWFTGIRIPSRQLLARGFRAQGPFKILEDLKISEEPGEDGRRACSILVASKSAFPETGELLAIVTRALEQAFLAMQEDWGSVAAQARDTLWALWEGILRDAQDSVRYRQKVAALQAELEEEMRIRAERAGARVKAELQMQETIALGGHEAATLIAMRLLQYLDYEMAQMRGLSGLSLPTITIHDFRSRGI